MSATSSAAREYREARRLTDVAARLSAGRPCDVDDALDAALGEGVLVPHGSFFCPAPFARPFDRERHDGIPLRWLSEGLEPFFVKRHRLRADQQEALAKIFASLR